jgi:hypothetical protein
MGFEEDKGLVSYIPFQIYELRDLKKIDVVEKPLED